MVQSGAGDSRSARLTMRVPAAEALVALVSLLKGLGDLVIWAVIVGWVPILLIFVFTRARAMYLRRFGRSAPPPAPPATTPVP